MLLYLYAFGMRSCDPYAGVAGKDEKNMFAATKCLSYLDIVRERWSSRVKKSRLAAAC